MKICIIGSSGHWSYALPELKNHTVIGIAAGFDGESMDGVYGTLSENGIRTEIFSDAHELITKRPDIAIINTRFDLNSEYTLECLARNIYVFSEKPLATSLEALEKIKNIKTTAFVSAMFGISCEPWCLCMRELAAKLGDIRMVNARKSYKLGTRPDFYKSKKTFGGLIPWVGIHALHWIYFTTGLKFKNAVSVTDNSVNFGNGDLETTAAAVFNMENGCIATVTADYFRPQTAPTHDDDRLRIVGSKGVAEYMCGHVTLIDENGMREIPLPDGADVFKMFVDRISDGISGISQEESVYITEVALRADTAGMGLNT